MDHDAHPAEAATRENGEAVRLLQEIVDGVHQPFLWPRHKKALREAIAVLSTHQQQGAGWTFCPECGCDQFKRAFDGERECSECKQSWFADIDYTDVVRKNLSRAPQPDTVTELVKRDCLYKPCGYPTCKCVGIGIDARELTAALAARGKAG